MRLVFDVETNGLLPDLTTVHTLVMRDIDAGTVYSCADQPDYMPIADGLGLLSKAAAIIGHNVVDFDIPAIKLVYPDWTYHGEVIDTLLLSRLYYTNIRESDFGRVKAKKLPAKLTGSHSLESWGYRIGEYKGEFGKNTDWSAWSREMQDYCEQDTAVTARLFAIVEKKRQEWGEASAQLEHEFAKIIQQQVAYGFAFDVEAATQLYATLADRRATLAEKLKAVFPPVDKGSMFVPKVNNKTKSYVKGVPVWREKIVEFNPASRDHIAERLIEKYGWEPAEYTDNGKPKVDDEVMGKLKYPECPLLTEYLMIDKRIGQLAEGKQAWLKQQRDGIIHGSITTNGAVTGRCTHHHPNIAQVPAQPAPYWHECRSLFGPPAGYYQLGCDASGLELRCLSHYLTKYDNGAYRDVVLHGDIHTQNQQAAGLATRAEAKRFIYAFLYGAGDQLIGSLMEPDADADRQRIVGRKIKVKFLNQTPALKRLIEDVKHAAKTKKFLRGLDGRHLFVRSEHSALNLLLQSAGALAMKKATVILWQDLAAEGIVFGREVAQMAHIHDEYQLAVRNDIDPAYIGAIATNAIRKAGEHFGFRCPLDGEYKTGANWAETH